MTLLQRKTWKINDKEKREDFIAREKLQNTQFDEMQRIHGKCYMVKFGENEKGEVDVRIMWEDLISIKELRKEVRTPLGTEWLCPLCQPYDSWTGLADMAINRRYLCRIIAPKYINGCIEETGTLHKCPCIMKPRYRQKLKFKP